MSAIAGVLLLMSACATTPPSLSKATLSAMPADVDVAVAARVEALRGPLATVFKEAEVPVPNWLLERTIVVVAGVYVRKEPGYLIWLEGVNLNPGLGARLLLSPDWFFVVDPYPHYRSVEAAILLPGRNVLLITNLPFERVQSAFDVEAFSLPEGVAFDEGESDLLVAVPDLSGAIVELFSESQLALLAAAFRARDMWLSGTAQDVGIVGAGAVRADDENLARLLAALASKVLSLPDIRLQAEDSWVKVSGLMPYSELIDVASVVLDPERIEAGADGAVGP